MNVNALAKAELNGEYFLISVGTKELFEIFRFQIENEHSLKIGKFNHFEDW